MNRLGYKLNLEKCIVEQELQKYDLFIYAAGADERAYQVARILRKHDLISNSILFIYVEREDDPESEHKPRHDSYKSLGLNDHILHCSTQDKNCHMRNFVPLLRQHGTIERIGVDISVFTEPYFLSILYALASILRIAGVDIFYSEPSSYIRRMGSLEYAFTSGQYDPLEIPGFVGSNVSREQNLLIILLGFEGTASNFVWNDVYPKVTVPVNGFPSYLLHFKDISVMANLGLLDRLHLQKMMKYAKANDPFETFYTIDEICRAHQGYAVTIAPLGPKPMSLGSGIYALKNRDVRIAYPLPRKYDNVISKDCGTSWVFRIPLEGYNSDAMKLSH